MPATSKSRSFHREGHAVGKSEQEAAQLAQQINSDMAKEKKQTDNQIQEAIRLLQVTINGSTEENMMQNQIAEAVRLLEKTLETNGLKG